MAEVTDISVGVEQLEYLDRDGNFLTWAEYIPHEREETQRYLDYADQAGQGEAKPPDSIMAVIAVFGGPEIADFDIRFRTRYVHDKELLALTLAAMERAELVVHTDTKYPTVPKKAEIHGRPSTLERKYYDLDSRAYKLVPELKKVKAAKQQAISHVGSRIGRIINQRISA